MLLKAQALATNAEQANTVEAMLVVLHNFSSIALTSVEQADPLTDALRSMNVRHVDLAIGIVQNLAASSPHNSALLSNSSVVQPLINIILDALPENSDASEEVARYPSLGLPSTFY